MCCAKLHWLVIAERDVMLNAIPRLMPTLLDSEIGQTYLVAGWDGQLSMYLLLMLAAYVTDKKKCNHINDVTKAYMCSNTSCNTAADSRLIM